MNLKSVAAVLLITASAMAMSAVAHAIDQPVDAPTLNSFFDLLSDRWTGKGVLHEIDRQGRSVQTRYRMELNFSRSTSNSWAAYTQVSTERGSAANRSVFFSLREGNLWVTVNGVAEPVGVSSLSLDELAYHQRRANAYGQVFDLSYRYLFNADGTMTGQTVIETNGVVVQSEEFTIERRF